MGDLGDPTTGEDAAALATLLHGREAAAVDGPAGETKSKPAPVFALIRLGPAKEYNDSKGLVGGTFVQGANRLAPLDVQARRRRRRQPKKKGQPAAGTATTPSSDGGLGAGDKGEAATPKNPWKTPAAVANPASVLGVVQSGYVGFHYECPRGCRFIKAATDGHPQPLSSSVLGTEHGGATTGGGHRSALPLLTQCDSPKCSKEWAGPAQLTRVYVVTPGGLHQTVLAPELRLEADANASTPAGPGVTAPHGGGGGASAARSRSGGAGAGGGGSHGIHADGAATATVAGQPEGIPLDPSTFYTLVLPRAVTQSPPSAVTLQLGCVRVT